MAGKHQYKISDKRTRRKANRKWRHHVQGKLQSLTGQPVRRQRVQPSKTPTGSAKTTLVYRTHDDDEPKGNNAVSWTQTKYKVRLTFTDTLLGSAPLNKEIYNEFVAGKAADLQAKAKVNGDTTAPTVAEIQEEIDAIVEGGEKGKTGFLRDADGTPVMMNFVCKGHFKESCSGLSRDKSSLSSKLKAFKKVIDLMVFVHPRKLRIETMQPIGEYQRPLRAQTAQGERIALAASETVEAGASVEFTLTVIGEVVTEELLREWLDYGALHGWGQFRSGGWGTFEYELSHL